MSVVEVILKLSVLAPDLINLVTSAVRLVARIKLILDGGCDDDQQSKGTNHL